MPALNLTSMIDVLFLLDHFLHGGHEVRRDGAEHRRAGAGGRRDGEDTPPAQPLVVSVIADGRLELDGNAVSDEELTTQLAAEHAAHSEPSVIIHGDAKCAFQHVASALGACRQAGISELGITVRIAELVGRSDAAVSAVAERTAIV